MSDFDSHGGMLGKQYVLESRTWPKATINGVLLVEGLHLSKTSPRHGRVEMQGNVHRIVAPEAVAKEFYQQYGDVMVLKSANVVATTLEGEEEHFTVKHFLLTVVGMSVKSSGMTLVDGMQFVFDEWPDIAACDKPSIDKRRELGFELARHRHWRAGTLGPEPQHHERVELPSREVGHGQAIRTSRSRCLNTCEENRQITASSRASLRYASGRLSDASSAALMMSLRRKFLSPKYWLLWAVANRRVRPSTCFWSSELRSMRSRRPRSAPIHIRSTADHASRTALRLCQQHAPSRGRPSKIDTTAARRDSYRLRFGVTRSPAASADQRPSGSWCTIPTMTHAGPSSSMPPGTPCS